MKTYTAKIEAWSDAMAEPIDREIKSAMRFAIRVKHEWQWLWFNFCNWRFIRKFEKGNR